MLDELIVDPSTAMLVASASSRETAPSTLFVTREFLTEWSELVSDVLAERLVTVLVAKSFDLLTSCVDAEFFVALMVVALALFEASEN